LEGEREPNQTPVALRAAAHYINKQLTSFGLKTAEAPIATQDATGVPCFNVMATLPNENTQKPVLVIGAHYDTVADSPGADDNASALAVLLEVARVSTAFFKTEPNVLQPEFVAFTLEEPGFLGSQSYLKTASENNQKISGAINLECVGYTDHRAGSQLTPPGLPISLPDRGDFVGVLGNEKAHDLVEALASAIKQHTPDLPHMSLLLPKAAEALPDVRRSDHVPFWDKDIPAIMLTDTANFRNPHYHQSSDRIETLDIPFITKIARALAATVITLASRAGEPC